MVFITIKSDNQNTSFVLRKNPTTSPHLRKLRSGTLVGFFHETDESEQIYVVRFIDSTNGLSFHKSSDDDSDYLRGTEFYHPLILPSVLTEMFSSVMNYGDANRIEEDIVSKNEITQSMVYLSKRAVKLINRINQQMSEITKMDKKLLIELIPIKIDDLTYDNCYQMKITGDCTLQTSFRYAYMIGHIMSYLTFGKAEPISSGSIEKICGIIAELDIPYYVRYLFKTYMIKPSDLNRYIDQLSESSHQLTLMPGNTQDQRYDFIENEVRDLIDLKQVSKLEVIDIGCGEGFYVKKLIRFLTVLSEKLSAKENTTLEIIYHAHDIDPNEMEKIERLRGIDNSYEVLRPHHTFDDLRDSIGQDDSTKLIIMSEVIEHVPPNEVVDFIKRITSLPFDRAVLTTPDVDFNVHYGIGDSDSPVEFRHDDHKKEYTKREFYDLVTQTMSSVKLGLSYTQKMVGDIVDSDSVSQAIVIDSN